ncbi:MAG: 4Fe-4S ferredoxin, iron-sulpur binding protein [Firmicutes bacterium]|jgi:Fe-S-cluster-containing dehydrogenase component|nr:4Fe-4S ferredoxin, iron-sulpur binding protein [Bacillota bacterium]
MKQKQLGFLIDLSKCVGCHACEFACKREHQADKVNYRQVIRVEQEHNEWGFLSLGCNHCENPECMRVCKANCYYKRRDGIVLHRYQDCIACKRCVGACPFHAPKINERTHKISKCNFCMERQEQGLQPACVEACVVSAIQMIDLSNPLPDRAKKTMSTYPIVQFTKPSTRFILPAEPICYWKERP